jgi:hypothetical protein
MPSLKTVAAALLAAGVPLTAAALVQATLAQGTGRWTTGTPMPSARTEIAVAEVSGKIYLTGVCPTRGSTAARLLHKRQELVVVL